MSEKKDVAVKQIIWKDDCKRYAIYEDGSEKELPPKNGYGAENMRRIAEAKAKAAKKK